MQTNKNDHDIRNIPLPELRHILRATEAAVGPAAGSVRVLRRVVAELEAEQARKTKRGKKKARAS